MKKQCSPEKCEKINRRKRLKANKIVFVALGILFVTTNSSNTPK
jgi:predicted nucleic acid-binding Zn ribbon protein